MAGCTTACIEAILLKYTLHIPRIPLAVTEGYSRW